MGGAVESTITGLVLAPLESWIGAQVGKCSGQAGACWPGMGMRWGRALSAKSRGRCGGPGEARPLRPTPRSIRGTLGAPEPSSASRPAQKSPGLGPRGRGRDGGRKSTGLDHPHPAAAVGSMFWGPQELTKGTKKASSHAVRWGGALNVAPSCALGSVSRRGLNPCPASGCRPGLGPLQVRP